MIKVAIIGAGSVVFTKNLTGDILSYPEFKNAHFTYMDIDEDRLNVGVGLCKKLAKGLGANPTIEGTLDRKKALAGADFVITTVQVGGFDSTLVDFDIPRKYGLKFTIADTTGPGGMFRALRTYPFFKGLVEDMEAICPNAFLLNYSNPMSMNMLGINRMTNQVRSVGLCHSVQGTFNQLMRYLEINPEDGNFICAGVNHMAFYLSMHKDGKDLYPKLFEAMKDEKIFNTNKVRFQLMRMLGYYVTESSEHNAEYCPYFIPHGTDTIKDFDVPIDEYLRRCDGIVDSFEKLKESCKNDEPIEHHKSHEYGSTIIHSVATNTPAVVYGNMPNKGCISNLPDDAIVEAPTLVDKNGLQFTTVGDLPPQIVGYVMPHIVQHELYVRAAMEGRRDHIYQACMNDPLTAATLTTDQIVDMCDEMIVCHGDLLPKLDKSPRHIPFSGKNFEQTTAESFRKRWEERKPTENNIILKDWQLSQKLSSVVDGLENETKQLKAQGNIVIGEQRVSFSKEQATIQGYMSTVSEKSAGQCLYAFTELESVHMRETEMFIGSSSSIEVWLNGESVYQFNGDRDYKPETDSKPIVLKEGWNEILVFTKLESKQNSGFSVSIPKADF